MTRIRWAGVACAMVLLLSSCTYREMALVLQNKGGNIPWWCDPTEEDIPVTAGPASGSVDWYAGTHKTALSWEQCIALSDQFDQAKAYALQWPTRGQAEADGWREATPYVSGMGTHHVRGGMTPAMLADPAFDPANPILDAVGLDDEFDPLQPEVLQFDGTGASAKLVGFDYYVRTATGLPPAGFPGNNDWWHHHPKICFRKSDAKMVAFNASDSSCSSQNGVNVTMANYYMLHVWILDDMVFTPDVYAGMIPCIFGGTAIHDAQDTCHNTRAGSGAEMDMGH